ncbi:MAG: diguanylate cyclase [Polyangiales bacterium]
MRQSSGQPGRRIAVVDDDADLRNSVARLLKREGHEVQLANGGEEGIELVREWQPHLLLLDYYMPNGTGADVVRNIRGFNHTVQVLLVTGYAAEQPARRLLAELDIQGYHDKGDGPERLLVLIDSALKHYRALESIDRQRRYMRHILDVAPDIGRLQPMEEVFMAALENLGALLEGTNGLIATANNGVFVTDGAVERMSVRAAMGRFQANVPVSQLPREMVEAVEQGMAASCPHQRGSFVAIPLRARDGERGCMVVEGGILRDDAVEACELYGRQVVQAIENVGLYEKATVDPLTLVQRREAGLERVEATLRLASRMSSPTSALLVDLDHFKRLNDTYGHAAGDLVLRRAAHAISDSCRTSDVVFRYGGEEFGLALPATDAAGASVVAERIRAAIASLEVAFEGHTLRVTASIGAAEAAPGEVDPLAVLRRADSALYRAKDEGRNRACAAAAPRHAEATRA